MNEYEEAIIFYAEGKNQYAVAYSEDGGIERIDWEDGNPKPKPTIEQLDSIIANDLPAQKQAKINLKESARAKLMAGEPLTEEEASTIVL